MEELIGDLIRGIGVGALWLVTLGRYRSRHDSRLSEGAIGFGLVVVAAYVLYAASIG